MLINAGASDESPLPGPPGPHLREGQTRPETLLFRFYGFQTVTSLPIFQKSNESGKGEKTHSKPQGSGHEPSLKGRDSSRSPVFIPLSTKKPKGPSPALAGAAARPGRYHAAGQAQTIQRNWGGLVPSPAHLRMRVATSVYPVPSVRDQSNGYNALACYV